MKKLKPAFASLLLVLSFSSIIAFAQTGISISGQVKDEKGQTLKGVSISVRGNSAGTSTDADGRFSLNVPSRESILVFSFIGYEPQEKKAGSKFHKMWHGWQAFGSPARALLSKPMSLLYW